MVRGGVGAGLLGEELIENRVGGALSDLNP